MTKNLKSLISYSSGGITSKVVEKTERSDVTLFCMAAGTTMDEHTSTREGIVYVIEGKGTFILEGKRIPMEPGALIVMPKNAVHALKASENTSFLLTLTK